MVTHGREKATNLLFDCLSLFHHDIVGSVGCG